MNIKLSVIVLNYNVMHFLELCLHSVQRAVEGLDAEIIVADNNSPDNSVAMVKKYFPEIHLVENKENLGFSKAYNQAVEIANGEYICVLNPDTIVQEDTFVNCIQKADRLPNLGIMGLQLIDGRGVFLPESKRNLPTTWVSFFKVFGKKLSKIAPYYADHLKRDGEGQVEILVGAFMLVKKSVYQEARGFDERYFMYGEDIDFSYSVQQLGYENYYLGSEKVVHFKGESTTKDKVYRERFYGAMKLFYKKYFKYTWVTDLIISGGIHVSSFLGGLKKTNTDISFEKYKLFGESDELMHLLKQKYDLLETVKCSELKEKDDSLIFLDTRNYTYKELLECLKGVDRQFFRFILPHANCAVGSDTSSGRGEVVSF